MAKTDYKNIEQYHKVFSGELLTRMKIIRSIINEVVPGVEECISYQIPCFKHHGYLIYYAGFPKHVSLSHPYSEAFLKHFKADLEGYKVSKAVIQIPNDKPLPEKLIKKIVEFRKKENEESIKNKKK